MSDALLLRAGACGGAPVNRPEHIGADAVSAELGVARSVQQQMRMRWSEMKIAVGMLLVEAGYCYLFTVYICWRWSAGGI
jgi:hypothetical protein